jgi:hypothetical protein
MLYKLNDYIMVYDREYITMSIYKFLHTCIYYLYCVLSPLIAYTLIYDAIDNIFNMLHQE